MGSSLPKLGWSGWSENLKPWVWMRFAKIPAAMMASRMGANMTPILTSAHIKSFCISCGVAWTAWDSLKSVCQASIMFFVDWSPDTLNARILASRMTAWVNSRLRANCPRSSVCRTRRDDASSVFWSLFSSAMALRPQGRMYPRSRSIHMDCRSPLKLTESSVK